MSNKLIISSEMLEKVQQALEHESPRGMVLLSCSWIEYMLKMKLETEYNKGSQKHQKELFSVGGPFHSFSAKIKVAHCAGWISDEMVHDLNLLKKIRNSFAHEIEPCSPEANEIKSELIKLKTPHEIYNDWNDVYAAEIPDGVIIYSGDKPEEAGEDLHLPGSFALKLGIPAVVGVLGAALNIRID